MQAKSRVFLWPLRASRKAPFATRVRALVKSTGFLAHLAPDLSLALKIHFGERGGTSFINPMLVAPVVSLLAKAGCRPFLTDTNTLYPGERAEAVSHLLLAAVHGFEALRLGAPVIIADGLRGEFECRVSGPGGHFEAFHLAGAIVEAEALVCLSHFKGHEIAGFGGALKNLGMGCASKKGKIDQHCRMGPTLDQARCNGCGLCIVRCRHGALRLEGGLVWMDQSLCVGCGACVTACRHHALGLDWSGQGPDFIERMVEYAGAVTASFARPCLYLNFVMNVTPDCDCAGYSDAPLCPDIGILAGLDPVAVDQASLDLVNEALPLPGGRLPQGIHQGEDKFKALRPDIHGDHALAHAQSLGLGMRNYHLTRLG